MNKRTPLYDQHRARGALMAEFAGWDMPIHYGSILDEAKKTRSECTLFDICHMGEFIIEEGADSGSFDCAITNGALRMGTGRCRYGFLLNNDGTVIDDLIIYRITPTRWMAVVNGGNIDRDAEVIRSRLGAGAVFEDVSNTTAKLDLQGPLSADVLASFAGEGVRDLKYFSFGNFTLFGEPCIISRTGYTGETGYEIYFNAALAGDFWTKLLADGRVSAAGLGARDILRIEAGLPLYGDELSETVTPLEAGLERFIDFNKEFTGREALIQQRERGFAKILCAIAVEGRRTPRHGAPIFSAEGVQVGCVTSGCFSPHTGCGIGFAFVEKSFAKQGTHLLVGAEGAQMGAKVVNAPFVKK